MSTFQHLLAFIKLELNSKTLETPKSNRAFHVACQPSRTFSIIVTPESGNPRIITERALKNYFDEFAVFGDWTHPGEYIAGNASYALVILIAFRRHFMVCRCFEPQLEAKNLEEGKKRGEILN